MLEYDVVVLGTGAAGLTAAITAAEGGAKVGVFEKHDQVGGTSAWSGGQVWIPNNPHMKDHGIDDSREKAITYMMSLSRDLMRQDLTEAYVDAGPEMVNFLESRTPVQFYSVKDMPDYHPEFPGGSPKGGRTIECPIYAYDELGAWASRVTPSPYYPNPHITMSEAWWTPVASVPVEENSMERMMIMGQRTMPGAIMVNRKARRFTNEAANYNAFGNAFHVEDVAKFEYENIPSWLIFDQHYLESYGFGMLSAGPGEAPDWVMRAPTLHALADKLSIDGGELEKTVERWNANCAQGADPDFGRGESAFDRWWGDPYKKGTKQATLGPLVKGPYYAVEVRSGALGTKGGPQTDVHGNVVDIDGNAIPGLYAAGNVMASPFGMTYGGPGGTLGPGMVFGYLSGKHAAERLTNR